jgi:putative Mg2+ transporter-C (MgtC) family protein
VGPSGMLSFQETLLRLLFAGALGAAIGIERDIRRRPAGIRTSMFVCMATALFTILSGELAHKWGDTSSTRIASNIVQGIGFLGAGAILRDGAGVIGMTTAATIFVEAAIGMAAGGGFYAVAGAATAIVLFALIFLWWIADRFGLTGRVMLFRMTASHADSIAGELQRFLAGIKVTMQQFRVSMAGEKSIVEFQADVSHHKQELIVEQFNRQGIVTEVVPIENRRS